MLCFFVAKTENVSTPVLDASPPPPHSKSWDMFCFQPLRLFVEGPRCRMKPTALLNLPCTPLPTDTAQRVSTKNCSGMIYAGKMQGFSSCVPE